MITQCALSQRLKLTGGCFSSSYDPLISPYHDVYPCWTTYDYCFCVYHYDDHCSGRSYAVHHSPFFARATATWGREKIEREKWKCRELDKKSCKNRVNRETDGREKVVCALLKSFSLANTVQLDSMDNIFSFVFLMLHFFSSSSYVHSVCNESPPTNSPVMKPESRMICKRIIRILGSLSRWQLHSRWPHPS